MLLINKTLIKMAKGLWGWIIVIVGLKMLTLVATTMFAKTIAYFLGDVMSANMTFNQAMSAIFVALVVSLIMLVSELLTGEAQYRCTAKARVHLRKYIFSKVLELDVGHIERIGPVSAITSSVDGVESMQVYYSQYLPGLIYCLLSPIYLFFQIKDVSLGIAILLFITSFILLPINNIFRGHIEKLKTEYWASLEDMTGYYLESIQGLTTFKLYEQDQLRQDVLTQKTTAFNHKIMDVMKVNFTSFLFTDGMIYGSIIVGAFMACYDLYHGNMDLSSALMVLMLGYSFFSAVRKLMNETHTALAGVAAVEKVSQILDIDTTRPYDPNAIEDSENYQGIKLENVSYAYQNQPTIHNVSMKIPKGKITAFVGMSGCGKSTLASLLMRFIDNSSGHIYMEGHNYLSMTPEQLRKNIIMVPQQVSLFSGTIKENLLIAYPRATDEELLEALENVRLKDWVLSLPHGLDTSVGDGGDKLSGGQRQKIGIARALLSQAEYIILDEATSSVDIESEKEIWGCIEELSLTRTLIIISHRLSSIENADCIYVISQGQILEQGCHEELMQHHQLYYELTMKQRQLDEEGVQA